MINKKKVSFFLPSFRTGGSEKIFIELANHLHTNFEYDIEMVCVNNEGKLKNILNKNIRIINLKKNSVSESILPFIRYLRDSNSKIIISSMSHCNIMVIISKLISRSKTKIIVRECSSIYVKILPFSLNLKKVKVIYNGYELERIKELSLEEPSQNFFNNQKVIVAVGRLSHEKGLDFLIKAFKIVRKELDCKLIILGEGPLKKILLNLAKDLCLEKDIHFLGYQKNPYPFIKKSNIFVLPSIIEGLPGALIQALILNKNIISTNCKFGPREILKNGKLGKLIPIKDKKRLAKEIINELNNPSPIKKKIDLDLDRFHMKNIVKKYNLLFKELTQPNM